LSYLEEVVDAGGLEPRGERLGAQHTASSTSTLTSDPSGECTLAALPAPSRDFRPALKHQYGKPAIFFDTPEHTRLDVPRRGAIEWIQKDRNVDRQTERAPWLKLPLQ
jgi:hypothetical protein